MWYVIYLFVYKIVSVPYQTKKAQGIHPGPAKRP
jgi:hypothetical protein